jgi:hypothetical protein
MSNNNNIEISWDGMFRFENLRLSDNRNGKNLLPIDNELKELRLIEIKDGKVFLSNFGKLGATSARLFPVPWK